MTPAEVLARHAATCPHIANDGPCCSGCHYPWPCDAVDQARQLQEAQERAERLQDIFRREASASLVELAASEERVARVRQFISLHRDATGATDISVDKVLALLDRASEEE